MEHNPYQTPEANVDVVSVDADAEAIRKEFINHEASVRSIGLLYYLFTLGLGIAAVVTLFGFQTQPFEMNALFLAIFVGLLAALYYWIGSGLRALRPNVRIVAGVFAALGLLSFPIGTIINGYILYLLFSKKGERVFSADYQAIVDATPHIKYKTSIVVWLLIAILILGIAAAVLIPMFNK
jgi:hypothetical protein